MKNQNMLPGADRRRQQQGSGNSPFLDVDITLTQVNMLCMSIEGKDKTAFSELVCLK